jgi:hypothetical protein
MMVNRTRLGVDDPDDRWQSVKLVRRWPAGDDCAVSDSSISRTFRQRPAGRVGGFHGMDGLSCELNHSRKVSKCRYSPLYAMMNWMIDREAALGVEKLHCIMETS